MRWTERSLKLRYGHHVQGFPFLYVAGNRLFLPSVNVSLVKRILSKPLQFQDFILTELSKRVLHHNVASKPN